MAESRPGVVWARGQGKALRTNGMSDRSFGVRATFCTSVAMAAAGLCVFVKPQQVLYLELVDFIICDL